MLSKSSKPPSSPYVFVVMSLAAFLVIFTICRRPDGQYLAQVDIPLVMTDEEDAGDSIATEENTDDEDTDASEDNTGEEIRIEDNSGQPLPKDSDVAGRVAELRSSLLSPEMVLGSLRDAGMIQGDADPDLQDVAAEIASRMRLDGPQTGGDQTHARLLLLTNHPQIGMQLLDQMMVRLQKGEIVHLLASKPTAATARPIRGSAIAPQHLILILMCSALVGLGSLVWLEKTNASRVLLSDEDVVTTTQLPVIVDFSQDKLIPAREKRKARRRRLQVAVRIAEAAVVATVLLILFNLATVKTFLELLMQDPLAAYSEAVKRMLG